MENSNKQGIDRRGFLRGTMAGAAALAVGPQLFAADNPDLSVVMAEVPKQHDESVKRLQDWIALPSIAAENRNYPEGPEYMAKLATEAGFTHVEVVPTSGKSGVFATLDAGASKWVAIYFMYDVKQFDPKEWSSPPLEAKLVDKPGLGKVIMGRGAVNSKGPQSTFLGALHAFKASGKKLPVNLVLVAEGEEEIASPNFKEVVFTPKIEAALKKCVGVVIPEAGQQTDGSVELRLGSKGVVELELISSGEKWGRGPKHDVHSSLEAQVDSPTWHLVKALNTLVGPDGHTPAVAGFTDKVRPLSDFDKKLIRQAAAERDEDVVKKQLGVEHWAGDKNWVDSLMMLEQNPTINIEGLVAGYTGPGGKTVLPHKAVAKIDMRLVPDMTAKDTLQLLKDHLAKQGYGDVEVNMTGGYDPNETSPDSDLIRSSVAAYKKMGVTPVLWPRSAGSWPGVTFTGAPLKLAAASYGLGHGTGAHAPDEYYLIDSENPKVAGLDKAVQSVVQLLYQLGS